MITATSHPPPGQASRWVECVVLKRRESVGKIIGPGKLEARARFLSLPSSVSFVCHSHGVQLLHSSGMMILFSNAGTLGRSGSIRVSPQIFQIYHLKSTRMLWKETKTSSTLLLVLNLMPTGFRIQFVIYHGWLRYRLDLNGLYPPSSVIFY